MFENAGEKLKTVAKIMFLVISTISVILAFTLGIEEEYGWYAYEPEQKVNWGIFLPLLVGGPVGAYVSCLALTAFGDLVEYARHISIWTGSALDILKGEKGKESEENKTEDNKAEENKTEEPPEK